MRRPAVVGGLINFVLIGAAVSIYGPALPGLRTAFDLSAESAGLLLSAHFAGSVVGIAVVGILERRVAARSLLSAATILLAAGSLSIAMAPTWPLALAAAGFVGLGFGSLDVGLNMLFASGFGQRSSALVNVLNAAFGAGAVIGPLMVVAAGGTGYKVPFAVLGALALATAPTMLLAPAQPLAPASSPSPADAPMRRQRLILGGFVAVYLLYVGAEAATGGWEATHLIATGRSASAAATMTALFWAAMTAGRLLVVPIALRVAPDRILAWSLVLGAAALGLAAVAPIAPAAYVLAGLALAPVFPTGLTWVAQTLPGTRASLPLVVAGATVVGVVFPPLVGRLITVAGAAAIPPALAGLVAASLLMLLAVRSRAATMMSAAHGP